LILIDLITARNQQRSDGNHENGNSFEYFHSKYIVVGNSGSGCKYNYFSVVSLVCVITIGTK